MKPSTFSSSATLSAGVSILALALAASPATAQCGPPLVCEPIPAADLVNVINPTPGQTPMRLVERNLAVAAILSQLDIDGDGLPDNSPDTDGDGLPDNWENGGLEALTGTGASVDRVVFFAAPSPIVPGTPPTPIFTRLGVATNALQPDTDGDGLSDFVEVFGLMFIDENHNGILDATEWFDANGDGLPSPGEWPINNSLQRFDETGVVLRHDFDGFVFTDPTNPDTDGDGVKDGEDNDPLINPRAFGVAGQIIVRFNAEGNADVDADGLGNGMDMGNDLVSTDGPGVLDFELIDNPENVRDLLDLFRADLSAEGIVPESAIEDLFGADWDGNGLWRTTDVRNWSLVIDPADSDARPPDELFLVGTQALYVTQTLEQLQAVFNDPDYKHYGGLATAAGEVRIGLGWQDLLRPTGRTTFIPDPRVWSILYSWRMPGFDIDGDGFIGVPNLSSTASKIVTTDSGDLQERATVALRFDNAARRFLLTDQVPLASTAASDRPFDDRIEVEDGGAQPDTGVPGLDGQITVPSFGCGAVGVIPLGVLMVCLTGLMLARRRSRPGC